MTDSVPERLSRGEPLRITMVNDLGFQYGAGIAACRQVKSFLLLGHDVQGVCWQQGADESLLPLVPHHSPGQWRGMHQLSHVHSDNGYSDDAIGESVAEVVAAHNPHVVVVGNLHGARWPVTVLGSLKKLGCLVVAFMHDCYFVTGRCAYPGECTLYADGCNETCPTAYEYPALEPSKISSEWAVRREMFCGPDAIPLATNSRWTLELARRALKGLPCAEVVYYGLDTRLFAPIDRSLARRLLAIPDDGRTVVLTGAVNIDDQRKGGTVFRELVGKLVADDRIHLVVFGQGSLDLRRVQGIGLLRDYRKLPLLYSAADVFVGTSREEAFGQTFCEAAACARPVVAFNRGGVPEVARHGVSARLANSMDAEALLREIEFFLENPDARERFGRQGRGMVEREFSLELQAQRWTSFWDRCAGANYPATKIP